VSKEHPLKGQDLPILGKGVSRREFVGIAKRYGMMSTLMAASRAMCKAVLRDIAAAGTLLTRLPGFALLLTEGPPDLNRSVWAYPLIGGLIGAIGAGVFIAASWLGLSVWLAAGLALAAQILATGGFHEDGLADTADGLGGGQSTAQKLEIMRDSRLGSYGALALFMTLGLRWTALAAVMAGLTATGDPRLAGAALGLLICTGALSRGVIIALLCALPPARPDGMGAVAGKPPSWSACLGLVLALLPILLLPPSLMPATALITVTAAITAALVVGWLARRQIGGYTGDVLGAGAVLAETAALIALSML